MLGASQDVVVDVPLPLEEHVCLADGVGLIVHLLAVEVGGDPLAVFLCYALESLLRDCEHPARADSAVVEQVRAGLDPVPDGLEYQLGHEFHRIPGRPVFPGLLVILLVEAAHQVLEDRAYGVVVQAWEPD